jgi:V8-like Glu-specific endopeptidase
MREETLMANTDNKITGSGRGMSGDRNEAAAEEYWTEERRAAAKPVPMPKVSAGNAPAATEPEKRGETGHTQHGQGEEKNPEQHVEPRGTGGQAVGAPLNYPYRTVGKLFFTQGGSGFSGSAAMITPNILLTAGHCVYNGGWSTNVAFYPSYGKRASNDKAYKFNYNYVAAWTAWSQHSNRAFDYGMIWFNSAPGNIIGWLGTLWNAPTGGRTWDAVGYPATPNPPFNGNVMDECVGSVASSSTSGTIGLTNDNMEHGSSGGPWITAWNETVRTHANGLQSFHIHDGDTTEYGPYFTQDFKGLMDWIANPANRH